MRQTQHYLLARRARQPREPGWDSAWQAFYAQYAPMIHRIVARQCRSWAVRDDCLQEIWLHLVAVLPNLVYDPARGSFASWLATTVRRKARDFLQRRRSAAVERLPGRVLIRLRDPGPGPAAILQYRERDEAVRAGVARLHSAVSHQNCEIVRLHWFEGRDFGEIALLLKLTRDEVRYRHHRAVLRLRSVMKHPEG